MEGSLVEKFSLISKRIEQLIESDGIREASVAIIPSVEYSEFIDAFSEADLCENVVDSMRDYASHQVVSAEAGNVGLNIFHLRYLRFFGRLYLARFMAKANKSDVDISVFRDLPREYGGNLIIDHLAGGGWAVPVSIDEFDAFLDLCQQHFDFRDCSFPKF